MSTKAQMAVEAASQGLQQLRDVSGEHRTARRKHKDALRSFKEAGTEYNRLRNEAILESWQEYEIATHQKWCEHKGHFVIATATAYVLVRQRHIERVGGYGMEGRHNLTEREKFLVVCLNCQKELESKRFGLQVPGGQDQCFMVRPATDQEIWKYITKEKPLPLFPQELLLKWGIPPAAKINTGIGRSSFDEELTLIIEGEKQADVAA